MARRVLSFLPAAAAFLSAAAALVALAAVLGVAGAGCDAGSPRACTVTCGGGGECPEGTQCGPDSFCYGPDQAPGTCSDDDDLGDSADDSVDVGDGTDMGDSADDGPDCDPCDPVEQCGCADGEGCYIGSPSLEPVCAAAGELREEGFCSIDTECASGYGCAFADTLDAGHCQRYCDEDRDCGGLLALCNRTAGATTDTRLCTSDCDPIDTTACAAGEKCTFGQGEDARWDANCSPHAGGLLFEPCTFESDCSPGLVCVEGFSGAVACETLCILSNPRCPELTECGGLVPRLVFAGVEYGACFRI